MTIINELSPSHSKNSVWAGWWPLTPSITWLGHIGDGHALLLCHEPQDGEDGKAWHETGTAVQASEQQAVPGHTQCL